MDGSGRRTDGDRDGERYTLAALTEAAGVSVRTVRYYISEGLLPPPLGAGPASHYMAAHLNRLALIGRLKDAYLPLKEIRRRLAGLDDAEVAALLSGEAAAAGAPGPPAGADAARASPDDDALTYIDRVLNPEPVGAARRAAPAAGRGATGGGRREAGRDAGRDPGTSLVRAREPVAIREASPPWDAEVDPTESAASGAPRRARPPRPVAPRLATAPAAAAPIDHGEPWLRIRLGEEAELLVSNRLLRHRRDKVDWLVRWARKVFD